MSPGTRIAYLVLALAVIASFLYYYARIVTVIPGRYIVYLDAALVVASSIVVLRALRPVVRGMAGRAIGGSGASLATFILDSVVYFLMAAAVLSLFGINVYQVILGSAFLAAVLGLATQSVLSNLLTGLMIEVARPFRVGDDVFISTATSGSNYMTFQYPVIAPKYFSSDGMYSQGVRGGRVVNISLNYTYLQSADGTLTVIPNGNMVYGAVASWGGRPGPRQ
ncbi:mechanosensitive ion channel family protein [Thermogymnomonas acidicola]|uniref:mechanosensitive ion channel family protein n=1 Tax=Thermogymnomonas acidicola TaxID=399579 RepID=UPI0009465E8B|nr:mechanosensitive ion channel family protein [Thermogymnomonas acidicola]